MNPLANATPANPTETVASAAPPASPSAVFEGYELLDQIGQGGMGVVHKARDLKLERVVAIKVLRWTDPDSCQRLVTEARTIAKVTHPNIVQVFTTGSTADHRPFIVMEYAESGSLDKQINNKPFDQNRAAELVESLARAIHSAHTQGVVHCDLKPANVLRVGNTYKITDFGLAKQLDSVQVSRSGQIKGTPLYMSPEQAGGRTREVGPASDIHALGAILYELLTGRPPFGGGDISDILNQVLKYDPASPSRLVPWLKRDLVVICLKCLEKAPARRYATAEELADDLLRFQKNQPIVARPASRLEKLIRQVKRHPWETATLAASVLLLVLLIVGAIYVHDEETKKDAKQRIGDAEKENTKKIADAKAAQDKERDKEREVQKAKLQEQMNRSLKTINKLRDHLLTGELKSTSGLNVLYRDLIEYYREQMLDGKLDKVAITDDLAAGTFEIGEMAHKVGLSDDAALAFLKAAEWYATLGNEPQRGRALVKLARAQCDKNDLPRAKETCEMAKGVWDALARAPAHGTEAQVQLAELAHLRGEMHGRNYETEKAIVAYTDSINMRNELAKAHRAARATDVCKLPAAQFATAITALRELGRGYGFRADVYLWADRTSDADHDYQQSHKFRKLVYEALAERKPAVAPDELERAKQQLGRSHNNLARFQARHRAYTTAKAHSAEALKLRDELVSGNSHNEEFAIDRLNNLTELLEFGLLEQIGGSESADDSAAAVTTLTAALTDVERVVRASAARTFRAREVLAEAHLVRAEATAGSHPEKARADLAVALEFLSDPALKNPKYAYQRAAALALKLDLEAVSRTDPKWEPVLTDLRAALAAGYRDKHPADALKRRYFKALAGDKRFDELVAPYGK